MTDGRYQLADDNLLGKVETFEIFAIPSRALKKTLESTGRQSVVRMVIMNDDAATVRVAEDSLASLAPLVLKSVLLKSPDGCISKC